VSKINSYRDLDVWQQSRLLVKVIYQLAKNFPKEEQFGLANQLRRAAISISSKFDSFSSPEDLFMNWKRN